jgi:ketosteroid isomerase-like protein
MYKLAALLAMWLAFAPPWSPQDDYRNECVKRCFAEPPDPEVQRQEIVNLEREAARAIQLGDGTYFRRVYSDDFAGTLSRGEPVNRAGFINAMQSNIIKYEAFNASDIKVHVYRDTAVATCMWSAHGIVKGQSIASQMRVIHVYVNGGNGWKVVAGQASALPPYTQQAL